MTLFTEMMTRGVLPKDCNSLLFIWAIGEVRLTDSYLPSPLGNYDMSV